MSASRGLRLCRRLLRLYPRDFRADYGAEIERVLAERSRDARRAGPLRCLRFWVREVRALALTALVLSWEERRRGRARARSAARHELLYAADTTGGGIMRDLTRDLGRALRSLGRRPAFAAAAVLTLALGIGPTTAIFSAVHAVLLRPLPYAEADRVVTLWQTAPESGALEDGISVANLRDLRERTDCFEALATAEPFGFDLPTEEGTETLTAWLVTAGYFEAAGAEALHGRTFLPEEHEDGRDQVAVLGFGAWQGRFGGDPGVVGATIDLEGRPVTVVGVMPPTFELPEAREVWVPRPFFERDERHRGSPYTRAIGRLGPGVSLAVARDQVGGAFAELVREHPEANAGAGIRVVPLSEHLEGGARPALQLLLGAVGLVLLVACANVAGLMLAHGQSRQREMAVRGALGASRRRLVREVLAESAVVGAAGCAVGVGLALLGIRVMRALGPPDVPRLDDQALDPATLAFAVAASAASVLVFSLVPALRFSRPDLRDALAAGGGGHTGGPASQRLRAGLVVAEIALAVVLLVGAGLLARSFLRLVGNDLGFDPEGRLVAQVFAYGYSDEAFRAFLGDSTAAIAAIPGVRAVGLTSDLPFADDRRLAGIDIDIPYTVHGEPPRPGPRPMVALSVVDGAYFEAMGIDLLRGRTFEVLDAERGAGVAIVNRSFAERHWPGRDPVGERIDVDFTAGSPTRTVVGVVEDIRAQAFDLPARPEVYLPLEQVRFGSLTFVVRADGPPEATLEAIQRRIWAANPAQAIWAVATLDSLLAQSTAERRFVLVLLAAFGGLALALAAVGIYGLMSFTTAQRTRELGLRKVLGGGRLELMGMVLTQGLRLTAVGVALGLGGGLVVSRLLRAMVYGIEPLDPVTLVVSPAVVAVTALVAAAVPAGRATRVDPAVALRSS